MNAATTESGIGEYGNALIWEDDAEAMKELEEAMKEDDTSRNTKKVVSLALFALFGTIKHKQACTQSLLGTETTDTRIKSNGRTSKEDGASQYRLYPRRLCKSD